MLIAGGNGQRRRGTTKKGCLHPEHACLAPLDIETLMLQHAFLLRLSLVSALAVILSVAFAGNTGEGVRTAREGVQTAGNVAATVTKMGERSRAAPN